MDGDAVLLDGDASSIKRKESPSLSASASMRSDDDDDDDDEEEDVDGGDTDNPVVVSVVGNDVIVLAVWVRFFSVFSFAILLLLLLLVVVRVRYDHNRWRPVCPFRIRNARFVFPLLKNSNDDAAASDAASDAVPTTGVFLFFCFVVMLFIFSLGGIPKRGNSCCGHTSMATTNPAWRAVVITVGVGITPRWNHTALASPTATISWTMSSA